MRKYFLLIILFCPIVLGCRKNSEPADRITNITLNCCGESLTISDYLSKEDIEVYAKDARCVCGRNSNFYVYVFKDKKLYIKEFEKQTKQNIWSFVSKTNFPIGNAITINEGYGVINTYIITITTGVREIVKYENNYALLVMYDPIFYNSGSSYNPGGGSYYLFSLFIVSNGNESLIDIEPLDENCHLFKWFENSFLLFFYPTTNPIAPKRCCQCYSYSGNLLYETQSLSHDIGNLLNNNICLALNFDECLLYTGNYFTRYNLKENKEIWKSKEPITLPSKVRIGFQGFKIIDKDFTKFTINYTTYEGDKKAIAFKINNNTGEYVQL